MNDVVPQMPAEGIVLKYKFDDLVAADLHCECSSTVCAKEMILEVEDGLLTIKVYGTLYLPLFRTAFSKKLENFWKRIRYTFAIWFKGNLELQCETVYNEQKIVNLLAFLQSSTEEMKKYREEMKKYREERQKGQK